MRIPWKLKSAAFGAIATIGAPPALYFMQKHVTGRSKKAVKDISPYWEFHADVLQRHGSHRVIEFGAGKNVAQNLYLRARLDIEQTVVDLHPMLDFGLINRAIDMLRDRGMRMQGHVGSVHELDDQYKIRYMAPLDMQNTPFANNYFDACISTNTLEHIPESVIKNIWVECRRVLRPNGMVSARIDYSDHYAHTDRKISELNYLRYSEDEWRRYNHSHHFQNRLRHGHHLQLLQQAGFNIEMEVAEGKPRWVPGDLRAELMAGEGTDTCLAGRVVAVNPG